MKTRVLFRVRKTRPHILFAVLLDQMEHGAHLIYILDEPLFYERYDKDLMLITRAATAEEYAPLVEELQRRGFELYLVKGRKGKLADALPLI